jgi:hypothetical protein
MEYAGNISGNKPHVRKYNVDGGATCLAGVAIQSQEAVADTGGCIPQTVEVCVGCLGVALADAVSTDAQTGTTVNNVQQVSTIINPDAMWRTKFSAGAGEDVAQALLTAAADDATGLTGVTGLVDENFAWGYTGANAGLGTAGMRQATGLSTLVVAMPYDIAAGDTFLYSNIGIGTWSQYPQFTTNLTQINLQAGVVDNDNANFVAVDLILRDASEEGRTNSYALLVSVDHAFGPSKI